MVHNNIESKNNGVLVIPKRKDQKHEIGLATSFRGARAQIGVTLGGVRTGRGRPGCVHKIEFFQSTGRLQVSEVATFLCEHHRRLVLCLRCL